MMIRGNAHDVRQSHLWVRRVGEAELNNALYPNHVMKCIHTVHRHNAVTNVAVIPAAAKPCNVIAGRKYIGGGDSELLGVLLD